MVLVWFAFECVSSRSRHWQIDYDPTKSDAQNTKAWLQLLQVVNITTSVQWLTVSGLKLNFFCVFGFLDRLDNGRAGASLVVSTHRFAKLFVNTFLQAHVS